MWRLADQQLDEFIDKGKCEFLAEYAKPFSMLAIADLLGVPEEDHDIFREMLAPRARGTRSGRWKASRWRTTRWRGSTTSSAPTSRTAARTRATTC